MSGLKRRLRFSPVILMFLLGLVFAAGVIAAENSGPTKTIADYYKAIGAGKCDAAVALRPGYSPESCQGITNPKVLVNKLMESKNDMAIVKLNLDYKRNDSPSEFRGHAMLKKSGSNWIIVNKSFHAETNIAAYKFWAEGQDLLTPSVPDIKPQTTVKVSEMTFGSKVVLNSCWNPSELAGTPGDRTVTRPYDSPISHDPPTRVVPKYKLTPLNQNLQGSIRRVDFLPEGKKYVALTFDLCERAAERTGYDADIINYLRKNNIKATFFAGGKWMRSHPDKTKQLMADPLFEVGNHSWTHGNFAVIPDTLMAEQILWTQAQYELLWEDLKNSTCVRTSGEERMNEIPQVPLTFRFPYGTCKSRSLELLAEYGLPEIQWDVVSGDPAKGQLAKPMSQGILKATRAGSIIICHANGRGHHTREALPMFIPKLLEKGYVFVTVSELLSLGRPATHDTCFELTPGDNERYNKIFNPGTE